MPVCDVTSLFRQILKYPLFTQKTDNNLCYEDQIFFPRRTLFVNTPKYSFCEHSL